MINVIFLAQFDTDGILAALYIVIKYIQTQYMHMWTYMSNHIHTQSYTCLDIYTYTDTCTNIHRHTLFTRLTMFPLAVLRMVETTTTIINNGGGGGGGGRGEEEEDGRDIDGAGSSADEGNKNQSQEAKSREYGGWVTSWTSLAARKSRVTTAVCALALSWWSNRLRTPVRRRRLHHAWKILGKQWLTYQSAVTVFLSSSGTVATWPNFAKKHAIICLEALLFLLNFTGGFSSGKPTPSTVGVVLVYPCFVFCYDIPNARRPSSIKFSWHVGAPVHPTPLLLFIQVMGHPTGTAFPYAKTVVKNASETSTSCISAHVIVGSFLIRDSTLETFSGVTVVAIWPQRLSSSNVLATDMNCLNHLKTVALNGDWSPKQCLKLWKHSWKVFFSPGSSHNTS